MDEDMRIRKVSASEQVCEAIQAQISSGTWKEIGRASCRERG